MLHLLRDDGQAIGQDLSMNIAEFFNHNSEFPAPWDARAQAGIFLFSHTTRFFVESIVNILE